MYSTFVVRLNILPGSYFLINQGVLRISSAVVLCFDEELPFKGQALQIGKIRSELLVNYIVGGIDECTLCPHCTCQTTETQCPFSPGMEGRAAVCS